MAGRKSYFHQRGVLAWLFGDPTTYANLYLALFLGAPNPATDTAVEVTGGGYARLAVANNLTNFTAPSTDTITGISRIANATVITFPAATATWGTIEGFAWCTGPVGVPFYWGEILPGITILSGAIARFPVGSLVITEK